MCDGVDIGPAVFRPLLEKAFLNECIEVGVEPSVVNLGFVVVLEFGLDSESVGSSKPSVTYRRSRWKPVRSYMAAATDVGRINI